MNNNGPKTFPCGTPHKITIIEEKQPSVHSTYVLFSFSKIILKPSRTDIFNSIMIFFFF